MDIVPEKKKPNSALQKTQKAVKKKMFGYIAAGLGLVAGLAWNDAVKAIIDRFIPDTGNTIVAKVFYAIIVTVFVALVLFYLEKSTEEDTTTQS